MKNTKEYDAKAFLAIFGLFTILFLLILTEIFAFDEYKPSRFFSKPNRTEPVVASAFEDVRSYRTKQMDIKIYLTTQNLLVGSCRSTVAVDRTIYTDLNPIRDRLNALFEGPTVVEKASGYVSSFEGWNQVFMGTVLQRDGTLLIRFSEEVINPESNFYLGRFDNDCGRGVWQQIYQTVKTDPRVKYVIFMVNDDPWIWNEYITKFECPPIKTEQMTDEDFIFRQKQCGIKNNEVD